MNKISLTNFRVFEHETTFELAPITILTGKNNSGKSSLIKSFILLSDYLESEDDHTFLDLNGKSASKHKITDFDNLRNWNHEFDPTSSESVYVKFFFKKGEYTLEFIFDGWPEETQLDLFSFRIVNDNIDKDLVLKRNRIEYSEFYLSVSQHFIDYLTKEQKKKGVLTDDSQFLKQYNELILRFNDIELMMSNEELSQKQLKELILEKQNLETRFTILKAEIKKSKTKQSGVFYQSEISFLDHDLNNYSIPKLIQAALLKYTEGSKDGFKFKSSTDESRTLLKFSEELSKLLNFSAYHLGPNRTYQSRLYFKTDSQSEISMIINDYLRSKPVKGSPADLFIKRWLKVFELGEEVIVEPVEGLANKVSIVRDGRKTNLTDLGFGAGQILTILLRVASIINAADTSKAAKTKFILIEEPEANLHPKLQSLLADFFSEATQKYKLQFVLETHSEYLIRKTQVLVKEKQMDDLFKVYYFDEKGPYEVRYCQDGVFKDEFGPGFFDESAALTFELL